MNSAPNQQRSAASASQTFIRKPIVDWSEETIVINGSPLTIIFPDEDKPLDSDEYK